MEQLRGLCILALLLVCTMTRVSGDEKQDHKFLLEMDQECVARGPQNDDYRLQKAGVCAETVCVMGVKLDRKTKRRKMYLRDVELDVCHELGTDKAGCQVVPGNPQAPFPGCCPVMECNGIAVNEPYHRPEDLKLVMI